jgi:hypothetical protein
MLPLGKQQEILDFSFDEIQDSCREGAGTPFIEDGVV